MVKHLVGLGLTPLRQSLCQPGIVQRQNLCCQQPGVGRPGFTDGERTNRNAAWHLHDGIQTIDTA
ncbi:hypothetical protein D3C80_2198500 [compost metagenome]